jgi:acetylornithine deacetylase/succinyl-diaminopimelate desuccinylase-like protein
MRMLTSLHDENGDLRVPGLPRGVFLEQGPTDEEFRATAGVLDGVSLVGSGSLADRLWSSYAVTVTGLDVPNVSGAINAVQPVARARVTVRTPPAGDPKTALNDVTEFLKQVAPWGVHVSFGDFVVGSGFLADSGGRARTAINNAMERVFGRPPHNVGQGGSIPLVATLARQFPLAEILLYGAEDADAAIHAPNERVVLDELRRIITAEALFLAEYGRPTI